MSRRAAGANGVQTCRAFGSAAKPSSKPLRPMRRGTTFQARYGIQPQPAATQCPYFCDAARVSTKTGWRIVNAEPLRKYDNQRSTNRRYRRRPARCYASEAKIHMFGKTACQQTRPTATRVTYSVVRYVKPRGKRVRNRHRQKRDERRQGIRAACAQDRNATRG